MTEDYSKCESKKSIWLGALIGFSAGAVVGAVTALLLAPQSGEETRDKIKERFNDISDKAGDMVDRSREVYGTAKSKVASTYGDVAEKTTAYIGQAKEKIASKIPRKGEETSPEEV